MGWTTSQLHAVDFLWHLQVSRFAKKAKNRKNATSFHQIDQLIFVQIKGSETTLPSGHTISKIKVNIQDFLQGSGIGKMEDNLTSADPLSSTKATQKLNDEKGIVINFSEPPGGGCLLQQGIWVCYQTGWTSKDKGHTDSEHIVRRGKVQLLLLLLPLPPMERRRRRRDLKSMTLWCWSGSIY